MFKIKIEELQVLLNYLQKKPFIETASLIAMIQKLDKIEEVKVGMQVIITDTQNNLNTLVQHASDRFDSKRTALEEGAQRRQDFLTEEMKNLEGRFGVKLQRALSNPLTGQ